MSSSNVGLKLSPTIKTKIKYYIRYVDSLRVGDRAGGGEKEQIRLNLK